VKQLLLKEMGLLGKALRKTPVVRWRWLGRVYDRLAVQLGKTDSVMVGPFRVHLDPRDQVIAKKLIVYGGFETHEIELLCSLVRPGDCVLDVGANIGLYSLALSRAVGPSGRVIAVEPDPDNLALLRRNLQQNVCSNVTVVEDALGDESKAVLLYQSENNRGALSTTDIMGVGAQRAISVRMRRGDSLMAEMGLTPRVAKIDVEGAEPLVVRGLGARLPQVLLFEFVPWQLRVAGHDPVTFLRALTEAGYSLSVVDPDTGDHPPMTEEQIHESIATARTDRNILAVR
jgi:FkbM family methyltransferase